MGRSKLAEQVRVLPAGATVCGWCAEFEEAARASARIAMRNAELDTRNARLSEAVSRIARQLRENNCDEIARLERELKWAQQRYRNPFLCPLCDYAPKDGASSPLRSLRMHLLKKHRFASTDKAS